MLFIQLRTIEFRKIFMRPLSLVIIFSLFLHLSAIAQQVRVVISRELAPYEEAYRALRESLSAEVDIETYHMQGDTSRGRSAFRTSRGETPLFIAIGTEALEAAYEYSGDAPVVFSMVLDPSAFMRENFTGVTLSIPHRRHLEILKEDISSIGRVGIIYSSTNDGISLRRINLAASILGLEIVQEPVDSIRDVPGALRNIRSRADILWLIPDSILTDAGTRNHILQFATVNRFPVWGVSEHYVRRGALGALSPDFYDVGAQTGIIANRIIDGSVPRDIPIEPPRKVISHINAGAAEMTGIGISDSLRRRSEIIR